MFIQKTFEQWLQEFDPKLRIMENLENPDIDVLYYGEKLLCSVPKKLNKSCDWNISDYREDITSDGIKHRSLSGVGTILLINKIIRPDQFVKNFLSAKNKKDLAVLEKIAKTKGLPIKTKSGIIIKLLTA